MNRQLSDAEMKEARQIVNETTEKNGTVFCLK